MGWDSLAASPFQSLLVIDHTPDCFDATVHSVGVDAMRASVLVPSDLSHHALPNSHATLADSHATRAVEMSPMFPDVLVT
jgi:hypothetical protein